MKNMLRIAAATGLVAALIIINPTTAQTANPCHPQDTIGVDSANYDDFNGYQHVYSVNVPALYSDTFLMDDQGNIIGHVPPPTPIGTYGPAARIVVCYNPDVQNLYDSGRLTKPVPETTTTTVPATTTTIVPPTTTTTTTTTVPPTTTTTTLHDPCNGS